MEKGEKRLRLHKNLRLMYYGNALTAVSLIMVLLPLIGLPLAVAGSVMGLVALVKLRNVHQGYQTAISLLAVGFLMGILPAGEGLFALCLGVAGTVIGIVRFYFEIQATNSFLLEEGREDLVSKGSRVWKYQVVLGCLSMVSDMLTDPVGDHLIWMLVVMAGALVFAAAQLGIYMDYLEKSYQVFA